MEENNALKCVECGSELKTFTETNAFNHFTTEGVIDKTVLIENLPMLLCSNLECDEEYMSPDAYDVIQEIMTKISAMEGKYFITDFNTKEIIELVKKVY